MKLSPRQQEIVDHTGNLVVAAPPGSGKTRVIVEKTKRLISQGKGPIKLVTFTRAAAQEMKDRIGVVRKGAVEAATFDSYCYRMAKNAGMKYRPPSALNEYVARKKLCKELGWQDEELEELLGKASCLLEPSEADPTAAEAYRRYVEILRAGGNLDFSSIARHVVKAIEGDHKLKPLNVGSLLVDEFQDADQIQLAWVLAHARRTGCQVMVVGDDDQSIYGWRGGLGYDAMKAIEKQLGAEVIKLDQCFRCRPEIVEHARVLIANNLKRFHKPVMTPRMMGGTIEHINCADDEAAALTVLVKWKEMGSPRFAVLGRRNKDLDAYQALLAAHGVSVDRVGGKSFWKAAGAQAMLDLLSVIINPSDKKALNAVLGYISVEHNDDGAVVRAIERGAVEALRQEDVIIDTNKKEVARIVVAGQRGIKTRKGQEEIMRDVVNLVRDNEKTGWKQYKAADTAVNVIQRKLMASKEENLVEIVKGIKVIAMSESKKDGEQQPAATISTMHGAKGREWPLVFIVNANDGITPNQKQNHPLTPEGKEEERRLFYVAITRAEDHLVIVSTSAVGKAKGMIPSPFIMEAGIGHEDKKRDEGEAQEGDGDGGLDSQPQKAEERGESTSLLKRLIKRAAR